MAKVIAPFKIIGTLDDLNFYLDENKVNLVRTKGNTGVSSKEFKTNPIFTKVRNHGAEFGHCTQIAHTFRKLANQFNLKAKDGSFAGRANKLLVEILQEDTTNESGKRTVANGLDTIEGKECLIGFEGNKQRPLNKVLKTKWHWNDKSGGLIIANFNPGSHIDWPIDATQAHIAIARANWDYENNTFDTAYSDEYTFEIDSPTNNCEIKVGQPKGNNLQLLYVYIGFSKQDRKKTTLLKRINNTVSLCMRFENEK